MSNSLEECGVGLVTYGMRVCGIDDTDAEMVCRFGTVFIRCRLGTIELGRVRIKTDA